jgi:hypothetical protein
VGYYSRLKIWRPSGLTLRCMPNGKGPLRNLLQRICSEESLHYCILELSARNPLERDQVQRAFGKSSRSCHRTSNNQTYSRVWKSLEDSLPKLYCVDLAEAYVIRESVSSRILCEKKRYDLRSPSGHLHEKPSAKGGYGIENR